MNKQNNCSGNEQFQLTPRYIQTIIFEFDPITGKHFVSPFISEMLPGNYDDRKLSQVMLEDGVLHPDDTSKMLHFRNRVMSGDFYRETISMRLKTHGGNFRWYRMSVCICMEKVAGHPIVVGTIEDVDDETRLRA